jgi:hypothetical protein
MLDEESRESRGDLLQRLLAITNQILQAQDPTASLEAIAQTVGM